MELRLNTSPPPQSALILWCGATNSPMHNTLDCCLVVVVNPILMFCDPWHEGSVITDLFTGMVIQSSFWGMNLAAMWWMFISSELYQIQLPKISKWYFKYLKWWQFKDQHEQIAEVCWHFRNLQWPCSLPPLPFNYFKTRVVFNINEFGTWFHCYKPAEAFV